MTPEMRAVYQKRAGEMVKWLQRVSPKLPIFRDYNSFNYKGPKFDVLTNVSFLGDPTFRDLGVEPRRLYRVVANRNSCVMHCGVVLVLNRGVNLFVDVLEHSVVRQKIDDHTITETQYIWDLMVPPYDLDGYLDDPEIRRLLDYLITPGFQLETKQE